MLSVDKMIKEVIMQGVGWGDGFSNFKTARATADDDNLTAEKLMACFDTLPPPPAINGRIEASEAVREQYRFPRTKKRRIRNKWAARPENYRPSRRAWVLDGTIYVHPTKLSLLNTAVSHGAQAPLAGTTGSVAFQKTPENPPAKP